VSEQESVRTGERDDLQQSAPALTTSAATVEWIALTLECGDARALAEFWAAVLGGQLMREETQLAAAGLTFAFHEDPAYEPPTWPSPEVPLQAHLEVVVTDLEAEVERTSGLGAAVHSHQDPDDPDYVVMLDPAGHPFCLIRSSAASRG